MTTANSITATSGSESCNAIGGDYKKVVREMVNACAEAGKLIAKTNASAGNMEAIYLYFKPSTEKQNGELILIPDSETPPLGFSLATGEGLRCNIPYDNYFAWVSSRSTRLPLFSWV